MSGDGGARKSGCSAEPSVWQEAAVDALSDHVVQSAWGVSINDAEAFARYLVLGKQGADRAAQDNASP